MGDEASIKAKYVEFCVKCHGLSGKGDTTMGRKLDVKDWTKDQVQDGMKNEDIFRIIKFGSKNGNVVKMKPAENFTDAEIKEMITYIRKFRK
jgi:cytochrome c6